MSNRITGIDLARALAIFGMLMVNFSVVMNAETGNRLLLSLTQLLQGRASALFVILAGIGISLMSEKARQSCDNTLLSITRLKIIKRALLMILIGLLFSLTWPGDILHFYGFYFLISATLIMNSDKSLLKTALLFTLMFPALMLLFDYERNWDWSTLTYTNQWSVDGFVRRIVFNGFHPIFPWSAFLIFGMWLGRRDLTDISVRKRLLYRALFSLIVVESGFYFLRFMLIELLVLEIGDETKKVLFSISAMPPLPQYIISSAASAVIILVVSLWCAERNTESRLLKILCKTGQMSLTIYIAHVLVGMGFLEAIGRLHNQSIEFSVISTIVFYGIATVASVFWLRYFKSGPLEWGFRKLTN